MSLMSAGIEHFFAFACGQLPTAEAEDFRAVTEV